jgi:nucleoid DNA-binding protein
MAELKTKATNASVKDYIGARANKDQKKDARALMALFRKITGKTARMWGPSIVGYGSLEYRLKSGRTGHMPRAAFAIRGRDLVVYVLAESKQQKALRARLGKHSMGKSCLYFRRLADLDQKVLEKLVVGSVAEFRRL